MDSPYDQMLFEMLKECKTLPVFLDHIFGFLERRTDFYHITTDPNSPVGLPQGMAEQIVRDTFYKWMPRKNPIIEDLPPKIIEIPDVMDEVTIETTEETSSNTKEIIKATSLFSTSEAYNGAIYNNYCWSQNITDVDITVLVPENSTKKDLSVTILSDKINVKVRDETILLQGEFCQKVKHNDAFWSLENSKLQIHLEKCREMWWDCLVKSEPRLDLRKIDCSRPLEDLPEEAQAKIEELQWNQERKRQGLPTSDELIMHEKLRKAWNVEGSPFSGPFDPSSVILK